ncbi:ABC transporter permease [Candidatus Borkfalkia ceftriaxoniphila]|jgi:ABC transporter, permease protein|uniref:ABC transporter permease n=1 Tax=Candidatus Borkfalkia ceftriaxoniphila TaxID=2508949 RepID=A0A4Q2KGY8_9FIRM|nr:ABC transporter permease [Candidatus Borkfalkia ceftriaxoniphila]RXZ62271.1 ABC transporter permease [Candidatus Borkfalkia ceftriaxoniphila]
MVKYIIKRILLAIVILFGVSVIIYSLVRMMPGDFITNKFMQMVIDGKMSEKEFNRLLEVYGLADRSFWGILKGYFTWIGNVFQGDLGRSFKYEDSVSTIIVENMGISFGIAFAALILEFIIAIPLGVKAATNQYGVVDYSASVLSMIGTALPTFFFAAICIQLFSVQLGWFPVNGLTSTLPSDATEWTRFWDKIWHLVIPVFIMVFLSVGSLMRYTRTNTLEVLNADYIRTARAKGLSEGKVIYKHAFRNTLIPLVTLLAGTLPGLFSGAMITEQMFAIPGIGLKAYEALKAGDIPFIMGYNMFLAILTVLGTLLADLMYAVVDPRVKILK